MDTEPERAGRHLREIRRRSHQTQVELASLARVPRGDVIKIEDGRIADVRLERTRRVFAAAGGRARLTVCWNGALADRLLDERHAALGERALGVYSRWRWETALEVTFSEFGERGSIDLLTGHRPTRSAVVNEVKSALGSIEETNRLLDVKVRLAAKLVHQRFGWWPETVSRVLILPSEDSIRRTVARLERTMAAMYPARSREVRAWIRRPQGTLNGLWFLSEVSNTDSIPR